MGIFTKVKHFMEDFMGEVNSYSKFYLLGILIRKDGTIFEGVFEWGDFKWGAKFWWDVKNFKTSYEMGKMFEWQLNGKGV